MSTLNIRNNQFFNVFYNIISTKIEDSEEKGFTGDPSTWFSDEEYMKSFNLNFGDGENKDYYFNSYSHFHIHEEMLKYRVRLYYNNF